MSKENYCCYDMECYAEDYRVAIFYNNKIREYLIPDLEGLFIVLEFCPWCGKKLPKSLRSEWYSLLETEWGIETDVGEEISRKDIPSEFCSDEWWKKRGL